MRYESIHNDDLFNIEGNPLNLVGDFHNTNTPIIGWNPQDTEVREATDAVLRMRNAKAYQLANPEVV